jgi:hypothetical protein
MMQMLQAGGMPILTDNLRKPDADNPRGYLEFEPVKALKRDSAWVPQGEGKAVKIVYALLRYLPSAHSYKVLMMHRDLEETIASQRAMLQRTGREGASVTDEILRGIFVREMAETKVWLRTQPHLEVLEIEHRDCLQSPAAVAVRVNKFLGGILSEQAMACPVDPRLYRHRTV